MQQTVETTLPCEYLKLKMVNWNNRAQITCVVLEQDRKSIPALWSVLKLNLTSDFSDKRTEFPKGSWLEYQNTSSSSPGKNVWNHRNVCLMGPFPREIQIQKQPLTNASDQC